jgi:hypothetical protein
VAKKVVCDFCSDQEPCARLLCTDIERKIDFIGSYGSTFSEADLTFESVGDWAACITCMELIQRKRRIQLVNRSFKKLMEHSHGAFGKLRKSDLNRLRSELSKLQDMFWRSWTGMVEPIENPRRRARRNGNPTDPVKNCYVVVLTGGKGMATEYETRAQAMRRAIRILKTPGFYIDTVEVYQIGATGRPKVLLSKPYTKGKS